MSHMIIPMVTVVIHPIDTEIHSMYPEGYRWSVMVGGASPADLDYCVNAGYAPTKDQASFIGESHGASVCQGLRLMGINARYSVLFLTDDPIPAEADHRPLVKLS